jgi:hypothetical protein
VNFFHCGEAEWELRIQVCTDLEVMQIEDASVPWPEERSPYLRVARIPYRPTWRGASTINDRLAFNPWSERSPPGRINHAWAQEDFQASAQARRSAQRLLDHRAGDSIRLTR